MSAVPLPEHGAAYQYLFDSYYGKVWRNDSANWNGSKPIETRLLYTADQLRAYGDAVREQCARICDAMTDKVVVRHPARVEYDPDSTMARKSAAAIRASAMPESEQG